MPEKLETSHYRKLVTDIAALYEGARRALVEAYWNIGKRIVEVEQKGAIKAAYGTGLLSKLSEDLTPRLGNGFSSRNLARMRSFFLTHPILPTSAKLSWSHYVELLPLEGNVRLQRFEKKALSEGLNVQDVRTLVRHELVRAEVAAQLKERDLGLGTRDSVGLDRGTSPELRVPELLKVPKLGIPGTYLITSMDVFSKTCQTVVGAQATTKDPKETAWPDKSVLLLDHGFKNYQELTRQESRGLKAGDLAEWTGTKLRRTHRTPKDLYTYKAYLSSVIDGDTFWVVLDAGMRSIPEKKLRLRGIDCPEIDTVEGQAAKKFVEKVLKDVPFLTVLSHKNDKYARYEADVFYKDKEGKEQYLNNLLLQEGYAVRVRD